MDRIAAQRHQTETKDSPNAGGNLGLRPQVRTKKRRKLQRRNRIEPMVPERHMQRLSLDFMTDQLVDYL